MGENHKVIEVNRKCFVRNYLKQASAVSRRHRGKQPQKVSAASQHCESDYVLSNTHCMCVVTTKLFLFVYGIISLTVFKRSHWRCSLKKLFLEIELICGMHV